MQRSKTVEIFKILELNGSIVKSEKVGVPKITTFTIKMRLMGIADLSSWVEGIFDGYCNHETIHCFVR